MQNFSFQLMPVMKNKEGDIEIKEALKNFLESLCRCTSPSAQDVGCCFRNLCFKDKDHQKIASKSILSLLQLKDVFERVSKFFQLNLYLLD
jgi:hypothetical protein